MCILILQTLIERAALVFFGKKQKSGASIESAAAPLKGDDTSLNLKALT